MVHVKIVLNEVKDKERQSFSWMNQQILHIQLDHAAIFIVFFSSLDI